MPLIVFNSTNQALMAEKIIESQGLSIDIVPLPPALSAECGLAIKCSLSDKIIIEEILSDRGVEYKGIFEES